MIWMPPMDEVRYVCLFLLFESAIDDLHADGMLRSSLQSHAIHAHVMCNTHLIRVPICVACGADVYGYQYGLVPVGMLLLPFFFAEIFLGHAVFLFLMTQAYESANVVECVCVVGAAE